MSRFLLVLCLILLTTSVEGWSWASHFQQAQSTWKSFSTKVTSTADQARAAIEAAKLKVAAVQATVNKGVEVLNQAQDLVNQAKAVARSVVVAAQNALDLVKKENDDKLAPYKATMDSQCKSGSSIKCWWAKVQYNARSYVANTAIAAATVKLSQAKAAEAQVADKEINTLDDIFVFEDAVKTNAAAEQDKTSPVVYAVGGAALVGIAATGVVIRRRRMAAAAAREPTIEMQLL
eukprot:NODE_4927_length_1000_cov_104.441277_g4720_i0.p1 GENE.NODE_4927_length_1000_cov_104.441277_g4720_i0~~NODE_4927_length_1000_cov_104.441277_g4720_i0.p1  ORF type:complete len:253 (+),score=92.61 NODE_4927_length_1000_cov_104.441277_g4720_i0:58-759(+)